LVLEALRERGVETHLVMTKGAEVWLCADGGPERMAALADHRYTLSNQAARISSGSFLTQGMVVAPCNQDVLTAISLGLSRNLLERAADVVIKERRPLVLLVAAPTGDRLRDVAGRFEGTRTDIVPVEGDPGGAVRQAVEALLA
jgi:polyprenyl P-hydroxybenzoate/phenylacrylic acid decarboxylase-like protein